MRTSSFTLDQIAAEFVEAAHTVTDWTALAESRLWEGKLYRQIAWREYSRNRREKPGERQKDRAYWARYYSDTNNRLKKRAYMRRWEAAGGRKAWLASPQGKASRKAACAKYRAKKKAEHEAQKAISS